MIVPWRVHDQLPRMKNASLISEKCEDPLPRSLLGLKKWDPAYRVNPNEKKKIYPAI